MARQARRNTRGRQQNPAPTGSGDATIAIRATGFDLTLRGDQPAVKQLAHDWSYILRVRTRWAGDPDMRDYFEGRAVEDLGKLGVKREKLQELTSAEHIEILLNWKLEDNYKGTARMFEAASEIPWEYLLSAATHYFGRFQPLLVTRCIAGGAERRTRPTKMLFLESAPGRINQEYEFSDEETRIGAAVNLDEKRLVFSRTEALDELRKRLSQAWDAVHVTGIDTHQAAWLFPGFYETFKERPSVIDEEDRLHDGMILRGEHQTPQNGGQRHNELPVRYDELAGLLQGSGTKAKPARPGNVVTLNLYYSGARTARELVRRGAYAALGFLDEIDDEFAELFFQAFYWAWCHERMDIPSAFLDAWLKMDGDRMHGTGIVIWLGESMVGKPKAAPKARFRAPARRAR